MACLKYKRDRGGGECGVDPLKRQKDACKHRKVEDDVPFTWPGAAVTFGLWCKRGRYNGSDGGEISRAATQVNDGISPTIVSVPKVLRQANGRDVTRRKHETLKKREGGALGRAERMHLRVVLYLYLLPHVGQASPDASSLAPSSPYCVPSSFRPSCLP